MVDQYRPHQNSENIEIAKADCNAEVVLIPGGCTSLAQPMDKCVNKPLKDAEGVECAWGGGCVYGRGPVYMHGESEGVCI